MLTVTLPDDLARSFRTLAEEAGQTLHECVVSAMRRYLEEMEEREDMEDARLALESYRQNPEGALSIDDVLNLCGLSRKDVS